LTTEFKSTTHSHAPWKDARVHYAVLNIRAGHPPTPTPTHNPCTVRRDGTQAGTPTHEGPTLRKTRSPDPSGPNSVPSPTSTHHHFPHPTTGQYSQQRTSARPTIDVPRY